MKKLLFSALLFVGVIGYGCRENKAQQNLHSPTYSIGDTFEVIYHRKGDTSVTVYTNKSAKKVHDTFYIFSSFCDTIHEKFIIHDTVIVHERVIVKSKKEALTKSLEGNQGKIQSINQSGGITSESVIINNQ